MSALEAKVRCPKCHFRFFVPLAEIGRDGTTPCPNCGASIHVKAKAGAAPATPVAPAPADAARAEHAGKPAASAAPAAAATPPGASAAAPAARPWWKFWGR